MIDENTCCDHCGKNFHNECYSNMVTSDKFATEMLFCSECQQNALQIYFMFPALSLISEKKK